MGRDEPPHDDNDLHVEWFDISDEQNAFFWLRQARELAWLPWREERTLSDQELKTMLRETLSEENLTMTINEESIKQARKRREELRKREEERVTEAQKRIAPIWSGEAWDEPFVRRVLESNQRALEAWNEALLCAEMQVPPDLSYGEGRHITEALGDLLCLYGLDLVRRGAATEVLDLGLDIMEIGTRWQVGGSHYPSYEHGAQLKWNGLWLIGRAASGARSGDLVRAAERLGASGANVPGLSASLRVEYAIGAHTVDALLSGRTRLADIGPWEGTAEGLKPCWPSKRLEPGFYFKPNQTKRWMAEWYRKLIAQAPGRLCQYEGPDLPVKPKGVLGVLWFGNVYGRMACYVLLTGKGAIENKCRENVAVAMTRLRLALTACNQDAGRLPDTLDQLVPDHLDAVPLDDFDGKPIRYSREKKILYSVGEDLKDDGGFTEEEGKAWAKEHLYLDEGEEPDPWQLPDPSWPIEFKDEAM